MKKSISDIQEVPEIPGPTAGGHIIATTLGGTLGTAVGGAVCGAAIAAVTRRYLVWNIINALKTYTSYDFMTVPMNEAIMILGAYQKNADIMRKIYPLIPHFLNEKGYYRH